MGEETKVNGRKRSSIFDELRDGVIYISYFCSKINDIIDGILNGVYYEYIREEKGEYAKVGEYVDILIGFRYNEGNNIVGVIKVFRELSDVEKIKLEMEDNGYKVYDIKSFRKILDGNYNEQIKKVQIEVQGELIEF